MKPAPAALPTNVPLVIQLGFAGARELFDREAHPTVDAQKFEDAVTAQLAAQLQNLPAHLGIHAQGAHFFCGISQIAIGGDTVFTRACQERGILQRVFLPQPLDAYLAAQGSKGPDFTADQQASTKTLLAAEHIIQTRVVSDSADRHERFTDVNLEIARVSDVVICLVRARQDGKPGGTHELADLARKRQRPVIVLEISVGPNDSPVMTLAPEPEAAAAPTYTAPALPQALGAIRLPTPATPGLPSGQVYCAQLKDLGSSEANKLRFSFKWAALIIVLGHVLATVLAVSALKISSGIVITILAVELLMLTAGLVVHYHLHHTHSLARWAAFRLVAEITRSMKAIGTFPVYLEHFFTLPFPPDFRALVRTISVLHLRDTARTSPTGWKKQRDTYVRDRLRDPLKNAQIPYHRTTRAWAARRLRLAQRLFYTASITALVATLAKLLTKCDCLPVPGSFKEPLIDILGCAAIIFPVLAVAALSLAAAFDLEAKKHTSHEMVNFLKHQAKLLKSATTPSEFTKLLIETESRLLGETVNWYARRSFVGVA
jgi:hypothetical protein